MRMRARWLMGVSVSTLVAAGVGSARADVATDGTVGRKVRLTDRDIEVGADLGKVRGKNLFHSFRAFDVETDQTVTFTGPGGLDNVIGRVTGGERSDINGTLASTVPDADLYLVNPAGIVFGPNARLDVPASFHASTADELRFEDGTRFSAMSPEVPVLSVAAPESFGFLGARPAAITVDRGVLEVPAGEALSLVGGNLMVTAGNQGEASGEASGGAAGSLIAPAGRVMLAGVGGPGSATVSTGQITGASSGAIRLTEQALVSSSGDGGGSIWIGGGQLVLEDQSYVFADNTGASDARGGITVQAAAVEVGAGSRLTTDVFGAGDAGTISVSAPEIEVRDGGRIASITVAQGGAGKIEVEAKRLRISTDNSELFGGIVSLAGNGSTGDAGPVAIRASEVEIRSGGLVSSSTFAAGDARGVELKAERLLISSDGSAFFTGIVSAANPGSIGDAGAVSVAAADLEVRDGGEITSSTFAAGDAGEVEVNASQLRVSGGGSERFTGIASRANSISSGNAGTVSVSADEIEVRSGGKINSDTAGEGDAGDVHVMADRLLVSGDGARDFTVIASAAVEGSSGRGGTVAVRASEIEIRSGGLITSSTFAFGDGGGVEVNARRLLISRDGAEGFVTGIVSNAGLGSTGDAGTVRIVADKLKIRDEGEIGSSGLGAGRAGDVRLATGRLLLEDAGIRTFGTNAEGGRIAIDADDLVSLRDAQVTTDGVQPLPGASLITLASPLVAINDSTVTSLTGDGTPLTGSGVIDIEADVALVSVDSTVQASSSLAIGGLQADLGARLVAPETAFVDASSLLRESCAARRAGAASSFTATGKGGLPPGPDQPLATSALGDGSRLTLASKLLVGDC